MTPDELLKLYDEVFDTHLEDPHSPEGKAHLQALRVIYERGIDYGKTLSK